MNKSHSNMPPCVVGDPSLAAEGQRKIDWVKKNMPVLNTLEQAFKNDKPFAGYRCCMSVHLEAKTAYLALVLAAGGAEVSVAGSNPLSTKDDVVAAIAKSGLQVYAQHGAGRADFEKHQLMALTIKPHIVIDDGGDLVHHLHEKAVDCAGDIIGACEETTAGLIRNRARASAGTLRFPVMAVNDAAMKYLFDNRFGTGESVLDSLMRTTNLLIAGKKVVIAGYGWCGKGIARCVAGMGGHVIVCEVDEVKCLEAVMDGFSVMPMMDAASIGDVFVTATGVCNILTEQHFLLMKDGVILANVGHFYREIDVEWLASSAKKQVEVRNNLQGYYMNNDRWINVVANGKISNISAADGHPAGNNG